MNAVAKDAIDLVGWPYGKDGAEVIADMRPGDITFVPGPRQTVYQAIAAVIGELAKEGIAKERTNSQGHGYKFRGIDDVYNALSKLLARHKLVVLPRMMSRELIERESKAGGALFYVTVSAEFDFVSAEDGSKHTVGPMYGEAMDSGDKATNKAMSAAYKYAAMQAFCIPTEGDNDADSQTHEVTSAVAALRKQATEYAQRLIAAIETGIDGPVVDIAGELKGHTELYNAIWGQLPSQVRRQIKDILTRSKEPA